MLKKSQSPCYKFVGYRYLTSIYLFVCPFIDDKINRLFGVVYNLHEKTGWSTVCTNSAQKFPMKKISIRIGVYHLHNPYYMTRDTHQIRSRAWNWWKHIFRWEIQVGNFGVPLKTFGQFWTFSGIYKTFC